MQSSSGYGSPIEILLVEDNPGDANLTKKALADSKVHNNMHVAEDGEEALAFLRQEGDFSDARRPDLILLDLNLPKTSGHEVLQEIKDDETLSTIPVVVLSSSSAEEDIIKTYKLHASCYVSKPVDLTQFMKVVKSIDDFWFSIVRLPSK